MDKAVAGALLGLSVILLAPSSLAQSTVELGNSINVGEGDMGIEGISISDNQEFVLAHGANTGIFLIDSNSPENNSHIEWNGDYSLLDSSFHPGGKTAIMVGEGGNVLRMTLANSSIEQAGGPSTFGDTLLTSVSWNGDGSWAYIGGEDGWIWRFRGTSDGGIEAIVLENRGDRVISGISCLRGYNICAITSTLGGIGIIDQEHRLHWIGGFGTPWVDIVCHSSEVPECIAISSDLTIASIVVVVSEPSETRVFDNNVVQLQGFVGAMTGIEAQSDGISLISLAPFGLIEHDKEAGKSFHWLDNIDAVGFDVGISNQRIVGTWGSGFFEGWLITDRGTLVSFGPVNQNEDNSMLEIWIGIIILGGSTLLIASLMASSSPKLSNWLTKRIGSEEERKDLLRKERRLKRKKGRA